MEETKLDAIEQPETMSEDNGAIQIKGEAPEEIVIPVKFNKEIKNLTVDEAAVLAQKGMKFDLISKDFEALREISRKNGKSVAQFIEQLKNEEYSKRKAELLEKCSGDEELAEHILTLEKGVKSDLEGFDEIKRYFPKIKNLEQLPESVIQNARLKGTLLLDEYLRYRLEEKKRLGEAISLQESNSFSSLGSQLNKKAEINPEALEFLKGLWK